MKKLAIFASGTGTNAKKIIDHFASLPNSLIGERGVSTSASIEVALIVSNKPDAGAIKIAGANHIPFLIIEKEKFFRGDGYVNELKEKKIDLIVLAGFLWKIPSTLINAYPRRIINIHPALLPNYGGKGMFGSNVHEAVLASKEKESGITIHYVDEHYDSGDIIFQAKCPVHENDSAETLTQRIHALEYAWYPKVIGELLSK